MKIRMINALVPAAVSLILAVSLTAARQAGESPAVLLERAIQLETMDGDLGAAIDLYNRIAADRSSSRAIVARALLHLGGCYEKLGRDEARKAYERLVRDYADQSEQAKAAQIRLAALGKPAGEGKEPNFATRLVWEGADGVFSNAPSPDGRYITYVDWESGNLAIRDLKANTSRLLTNEGTWEKPTQTAYSSRWSPDGKQIAYHWYKGSEAQLRIMAMDNRQPRILFRDKSKGAWVEPQDWSPDGEHVLARISRTGQPDQLALIPVKGSSPRVIKTFDLGVISSKESKFSPDGRYVVYDRTPDKVAALDLFILNVSGGEEARLVQHPADDQLFGWSPDGNRILFLSDRAGTLDFWAIHVANGKPQGDPIRVKRSVGRVAPLGFAKDGSFYYADVKVARDIFAAKIDFEAGKVLEPPKKAITRFEGSNMNPSYSPDGKWLAYVSRRGSMVFPTNRANALCIHSLESSSERVFMDEFVSLGVRNVAGPRWSPDSRSIAVAGLSVVGARDGLYLVNSVVDVRNGLYLVNFDTGKVSTLIETPPEIRISNHEFSSDNRHLFYIRTDRVISKIQALDLRSGEDRELYRSGGDFPFGLAVSPDGKWLATITHPLAVSVLPTGGGTPRVLHRFVQLTNVLSSEWMILSPEWTPDGKYILVGASSIQSSAKNGMILYLVPADGGEPKEIELQQAFTDRPTVHPDGRQIAFTTQFNTDSDADVWVIQNFLPD